MKIQRVSVDPIRTSLRLPQGRETLLKMEFGQPAGTLRNAPSWVKEVVATGIDTFSSEPKVACDTRALHSPGRAAVTALLGGLIGGTSAAITRGLGSWVNPMLGGVAAILTVGFLAEATNRGLAPHQGESLDLSTLPVLLSAASALAGASLSLSWGTALAGGATVGATGLLAAHLIRPGWMDWELASRQSSMAPTNF